MLFQVSGKLLTQYFRYLGLIPMRGIMFDDCILYP